ncbi:MAG: DNA polymerase III subunit alpha, partial [Actinomycetota bacterium]|nr:DNA polymerase III subunit alpha [Actinomycetota bacterium]
MSGDPFVHLHVASGYSLRYGANHPSELVERAAEHGMSSLALTDRDGLSGAVKFAVACREAGIRPIFGLDLAIGSVAGKLPVRRTARLTPARGGASVDFRLPRVTLLARAGDGWRALCRLTSATHFAGERGTPVSSRDLVAEHARHGALVALFGPDSMLGRALAGRRPDLAEAELVAWRDRLGTQQVYLEVVHHRAQGDRARAESMLRFGLRHGVPMVLTNAVRYVDPFDGPTADVLDASRRLVPLDLRHLDRRSAEGYLKSGKEMAEIAAELADDEIGDRLLTATARLAEQCAVDSRRDLGLGTVHFPELDVVRAPSEEGLRAGEVLAQRCEAGFGRRAMTVTDAVRQRLTDELAVIGTLGYPSYFLTVADVADLIRSMGVRAAARGSGAGSLVTYLLGISDVDPIRYRLLMERFLSPLRKALPDIDIDVESARRMEVYDAVIARYGDDRVSCVSMMDTYRVRHAIRDVGAALGMPLGEIDALAKAFPHIRANQARAALRDLPELRASGIAQAKLELLFDLVESLDGLPRHIALHPCGVLLSDQTLLDRTPVERSFLGYPMSQFDKDDVEELGLLKLDLLGIRMQSAIAHALDEVARTDGVRVDIVAIARDDPTTFELIQSTRTLGMFQIESPGQRELVGKFAPESFEDIIIDISLFRPGPVKSDMVTPFLMTRQGWAEPSYLHESLRYTLEETGGVVVFHEQVLEIVHTVTGVTLAEADEVRRALGHKDGHPEVQAWFMPIALKRGYSLPDAERIWEVLAAFGSFGFCKAHAAAFALPTYQSAWLKAHHTAAFVAGVLTHDPGMYPKRLILDDARNFGIPILGLDVNISDGVYRVEPVPTPSTSTNAEGTWTPPEWLPPGLPDPTRYGIRLSLADVKGINDAEVAGIVAGRPYASLSDFFHRAGVSRPIVERLIVAGGFDSLYRIGRSIPVRRRGTVNRRDLLLQCKELDTWSRSAKKATGTLTPRGRRSRAASGTQLAFDFPPPGDKELAGSAGGLPEMTDAERVSAELEVLGLDASRHVVDFYSPLFGALGIVRAKDLLAVRSKSEVLVAGVKVATQTPPVRSGRRVVFVTLDDGTGCADATFFEDAQGPYAATVFHSWLLVIRGEIRRTGPRGISLRATGAWELPILYEAWNSDGIDVVADLMAQTPASPQPDFTEQAIHGAADARSTRP